MSKVGDFIICKTFPNIVNDAEIKKDPNITIGKSYKILKINHDNGSTELKMLTIMGNCGECYYWSDYFYSEKESRKIKLEKLYNGNKK